MKKKFENIRSIVASQFKVFGKFDQNNKNFIYFINKNRRKLTKNGQLKLQILFLRFGPENNS